MQNPYHTGYWKGYYTAYRREPLSSCPYKHKARGSDKVSPWYSHWMCGWLNGTVARLELLHRIYGGVFNENGQQMLKD